HIAELERVRAENRAAWRERERYAAEEAERAAEAERARLADEAEQAGGRTEARGRRVAPEPENLRKRIAKAVAKFKREHNRGPSKNELSDAVRGNRARVLATVDEMVDDGELMPPDADHGGYWI